MLARGPQRDLAVAEVRDHGVRLHRVLIDGGELVLALDRQLGLRLDELDRAGVETVAKADVAFPLGQLAETVEETGPQLAVVDERRAVGDRLVDRADDRQLLVLDDDLARRRLGGRFVLGRHRGDPLARKAHPLRCEDRPILDRVAPVGIEVGELGADQHRDHARHRLGGGGVDRDDPRVGQRGAQDLAVQHSRHVDVAGEPGPAADLLARVLARLRAPDPVGNRVCGRGLGGAQRPTSGRSGAPTSASPASTIDL